MNSKNATVILHNTIEHLKECLLDLYDIRDTPSEQFAYGEKTAYVECLEWILHCAKQESCELDFEVEKYFPL